MNRKGIEIAALYLSAGLCAYTCLVKSVGNKLIVVVTVKEASSVSIYLLMPFFLCESSPSSANKFTFTDSWYPIISCQREITYEIVELSSRAGSKCLQTCI